MAALPSKERGKVMTTNISRRSFVGLGALAPAYLLPAPRSAAAGPVRRVLGKTGLRVSEVGMGVMLTSDPAIVSAALDSGVNYFDTARSYMGGRNEEVLAKGLGARRKDVIVATKCHRLGNRGLVVSTVEQSLRALRTDYIDLLQLHNLSSRRQVLDGENIAALDSLRKEGKIRFAGVTTHGGMVEVMDAAVEAGVYDTVLTSLNFLSPPEVVDAVARTSKAGVGVVAMKIMSGGYRGGEFPGLNPFQAALRWVLGREGVATTIPSMATFEQFRQNVAVSGTSSLFRDRLSLWLYADAAGRRYCRACGTCAGMCPRGADLPTALRALMYSDGYGRDDLAREALAGISLPCDSCPECTVRCRFGIDLPSRLAAALGLADGPSA